MSCPATLRAVFRGSHARDQMGICRESPQVDMVSITAFQVVSRCYSVPITDGQLTIKLKDLGRVDRWAGIGSLTLTQLASSLVVQVDATKIVSSLSSDTRSLMDAKLQPIVGKAISRWIRAGLPHDLLTAMAKGMVVVTELPQRYLGTAVGSTIYLAVNAAGYGWFIDPTPAADEESATLGRSSESPTVDPRVLDRINSLTAVEHELGRLVGLYVLDRVAVDVTSGNLSTGTRRLPARSQADAVSVEHRCGDSL